MLPVENLADECASVKSSGGTKNASEGQEGNDAPNYAFPSLPVWVTA